MLTRAHKLALAAGTFAGGLFSMISLGNAGDALLNAARIGAIDGVALDDGQMSELRGTGTFGSALLAFLNSLPPGNTVKAQLNDQTGFRTSTTMPVVLSCGNGITCPAGMTVNLSANNNAPTGSVSVSVTRTTITTH
jgi:hypothetical protein